MVFLGSRYDGDCNGGKQSKRETHDLECDWIGSSSIVEQKKTSIAEQKKQVRCVEVIVSDIRSVKFERATYLLL